jgi:hypothetical protein
MFPPHFSNLAFDASVGPVQAKHYLSTRASQNRWFDRKWLTVDHLHLTIRGTTETP